MTLRPYRARFLFTTSLLTASWLLALVGCDGAEPPTADAAPPDSDAGLDAATPFPNEGLARYPLETTYPEGGAYDPLEQAFYVGSLGDGRVSRIDRHSGEESLVYLPTDAGTWWTLGMDVDVARRQLWVCAMDDQREHTDEVPPYEGHVWVLDLGSGERVAHYALSDAAPRATCTDVVVAADGSAYVTDRESDRLYRITPGEAPSVLVTDPLLGASVIAQNAILLLPDESALLVLIYLPSRLVRVDLGTLEVEDVAIDGPFRAARPALSGADGMSFAGDDVLVAFTSLLARLEPTSDDWRSARSTAIDVQAGVTDVIHAEGDDYLLNGQAVRFALGEEPEPFALTYQPPF